MSPYAMAVTPSPGQDPAGCLPLEDPDVHLIVNRSLSEVEKIRDLVASSLQKNQAELFLAHR